jgi:hypothetical protein
MSAAKPKLVVADVIKLGINIARMVESAKRALGESHGGPAILPFSASSTNLIKLWMQSESVSIETRIGNVVPSTVKGSPQIAMNAKAKTLAAKTAKSCTKIDDQDEKTMKSVRQDAKRPNPIKLPSSD